MLTVPRVYYAMANDGVFLNGSAASTPARGVPVFAIPCRRVRHAAHGLGTVRQILDYMIAVDFIFFGLTASCLFVVPAAGRRRGRGGSAPPASLDDGDLVAGCWLFVANLVRRNRATTCFGWRSC